MIKSFLTLFWRNLWKNKLFSFVNMLGLSLGFTGFILSYQYINRETSYDTWNPNYENIFLVGLTHQGLYTDRTPPSLAPALKENFPEIEEAGRLTYYDYGSYPMFGKETAFADKVAAIDSSAAAIFQVKSQTGALYRSEDQKEANIVSPAIAHILFHPDSLIFDTPKAVPVLAANMGIYDNIYGISGPRQNSLLDYDLLLIRELPPEPQGENYNFQTYIQVKSGTDITALQEKLSKLYAKNIAPHKWVASSSFAKAKIYLDPLSHQHLRPQHGSNAPYVMIWGLGLLSILILGLAAANFTNLMMVQAENRAKEIAMKKIMGGSRRTVTFQFLIEVFIQCTLAALIAFILLVLTGNSLQKWFNDDLQSYILGHHTILQLVSAVFITTILSGIYPILLLTGYKPAVLIKGSVHRPAKHDFVRNGLLTLQFVFAIVFITGSLIINQQIRHIVTSDKGFDPAQVINFKVLGLYLSTDTNALDDLRSRLKQRNNIDFVTAATNTPGGENPPPKKQFRFVDKVAETDHIVIDQEYFETLRIPVLSGKTSLSDQMIQDTTKNYAVINETVLHTLGIQQAIGAQISGCGIDFTVVGVVKDTKRYGFEHKVPPTVYSYKGECGPGRFKIPILVKAKPGKIKQAIADVETAWLQLPSSEKFPLHYTFLDQQYARLHIKQQHLQQAFNAFTILSVFIAILGLFSMAAYQINTRKKEMSIRKVLGASAKGLFVMLNKPFFQIVILANVIAIPLSYVSAYFWLDNFAYKISISPWSFVWVTLGIILILIFTVSYISFQAVRNNPITSLREE